MVRKVIAILMCALLTACQAGALAETALKLPSGLKVIEEEAFEGLPGPVRVECPEGLEEIGPRAFANSGVTEVVFPASLERISGNAFEGSSLTRVMAPVGSVGWLWAEAQGLLAALSAEVACDRSSAAIGESASWTATAAGGAGAYQYQFTLYRNGQLEYYGEFGGENRFTWTFTDPGSYTVTVLVTDDSDTVAAYSETLTVKAAGLVILGLEVDSSQFMTTETHTWRVNAAGGQRPYRYDYTLKRSGATVEAQSGSEKDTFSRTFFEGGSYTLTVRVTDASGASDTATQSFSVQTGSTAITGVVRIYLHCDSKGKAIRDLDHPGHYELMLDNGDKGIAFDDHVFNQPVFTFNSAGSSNAGMITVYDSSTMPWTGAQLYTFTFSTQASQVLSLLDTLLRETWLDADGETQTSYGGYRYPVVSGPCTRYAVKTSNCFTAVAAWCSTLGYGTLSDVVKQSSSYADYVAWKMYDKYGSYWKYEGVI